jgi:hypothetical protein
VKSLLEMIVTVKTRQLIALWFELRLRKVLKNWLRSQQRQRKAIKLEKRD